MHVQNGVNAILSTQINYSIEMLESLFLQNSRVHVVLEVTIIYRDPNTVQTKRLEEFGIVVLEEVF